MTIDIKIEEKPDTIHQYAQMMTDKANKVRQTADALNKAAHAPDQAWQGAGRDAFNGVTTKSSGQADDLAGHCDKTSKIATDFAHDVEASQRVLDGYEHEAESVGLKVEHRVCIHDPGPPPPKPNANDDGIDKAHIKNAKDAKKNAEAAKAWSDWVKQTHMYQQLAAKVLVEKQKLQNHRKNAESGLKAETVTKIITVLDASTGAAGKLTETQMELRGQAEDYSTKAANALDDAKAIPVKGASSADLAKKIDAMNRVTDNQVAEQDKMIAAESRRFGKYLGRMPKGVQRALTFTAGDTVQDVPILKKAAPFLKKVPGIGTVLTGIDVGYQIGKGKNPVKAAVGGASGLAAGEAVGTMIGGPIGALVGGAVGYGTTAFFDYTMEKYGDDPTWYAQHQVMR